MFSSATANLLQYFTFPAELAGVLLAYIEIRHPALARRLSARIVDDVSQGAGMSLRATVPVGRVAAVTGVFLLIGVAFVIFQPPDWLLYGPVAVLGAVVIGMFFAARWVPRRALGTVGLIVAGLGLLMELYQVLALAFSA